MQLGYLLLESGENFLVSLDLSEGGGAPVNRNERKSDLHFEEPVDFLLLLLESLSLQGQLRNQPLCLGPLALLLHLGGTWFHG